MPGSVMTERRRRLAPGKRAVSSKEPEQRGCEALAANRGRSAARLLPARFRTDARAFLLGSN